MTRPAFAAMLVVLCACAGSDSATRSATDGSTRPDTQTVDGVLVMRHDAGAFARAPQWRVADVADVVFDGGEDPNLDLTYVYQPALFPDGSLLAVNYLNSGRVMHFPADGSPGKMVAGPGEGPGDVGSPGNPIALGDSIVVLDDVTGRVNWFTASGGWVGSETLSPSSRAGCFGANGVLPDRRLIAVNRCLTRQREIPPDGGRLPAEVITTTLDFTEIDTIASLPGVEMRWFETRYRGERRDYPMIARLTGGAHATAWGGSVATSGDQQGYVIERRAPDGTVNGRVEVTGSRRAVTDAMREAVIAQELERIDGGGGEGMVDADETRRQAREAPFADSLPPYSVFVSGTDGILWVVDAIAPTDTSWSATGFREDGEIVARLSGHGKSWPSLFLDDRVVLRTIDDDGVVRFEVRRILKGDG
jgi:hypothetical protein